jgi:glycosyltransferase involved in cell wall biosynthesis
MAAGKPVVVSRIAPLTEIVINGESGFYAEPENPESFAEKILWLLSHREEAQSMGKKGQEVVKKRFSAETMASEILAIYQEVLWRG